MQLTIALAQLNPTVGDIDGNLTRIRAARDSAAAGGADLVVLPELALIGYPPEDLVLRPSVVAACHAAGFNPRIGQETPHIISTLPLVAAGLGISIVPASLQQMNIRGVVYRRLKATAQLRAPLSLASRRGDTSAVVRQFLKLATQTAKKLQPD